MSNMNLNSKEILDYLSEYGISSINKDDFKLFMKDLKKYIKYEQRMKESNIENAKSKNVPVEERILSDVINNDAVSLECTCRRQMLLNSEIHNCKRVSTNDFNTRANYSSSRKENTPIHVNDQEFDFELTKSHYRPSTSSSSGKTTSRKGGYQTKDKRNVNDPVALYQYYQSVWSKHKLPGENDHANLRRQIRLRMMNRN